ncbi:hypothetical protein [Desulfuribacillus alkaliarsenatis]|uniref:Prolipoprotein diacylglyceryl transferase n=1 Tax=Desulfuribacillus alkaliarsenatis TaxID=766136 RepID=A0A1E5G4P6_9FIRM|nr:hypothetical protein [Desulfuribacillus alkaliarsenatis]OEF98162.1 hypothetical protein BHF68_00275 [Desulfuribacillus alkaliarsenatis]
MGNRIFLHYLIGFLAIRGVVEFSRINPMVFGPFSVSHMMSLAGIVFALYLMNYLKKNNPTREVSHVEKRDIVNISIVVTTLMVVSLVVYYFVQG